MAGLMCFWKREGWEGREKGKERKGKGGKVREEGDGREGKGKWVVSLLL